MTRILAIGAHPDDCECHCGATAALWRRAGFDVKFLTVTDGSAGHYAMGRKELAARRLEEAEAAAGIIGCQWEVGPFVDGELFATMAVREFIIRAIRTWKPDLVVTHRPCDYHPDHRYASTAVQDASYMLMVPNVCPDTPALRTMPTIAYFNDFFQKPYPFQPDVVVDATETMDIKVDMIAAHASQFYEWMPWVDGRENEVPDDAAERRRWLETTMWPERNRRFAHEFGRRLAKLYDEDTAETCQFAEAFEWCEYGAPGDEEVRERFFPFVGG